jgi:hypothetical protein
MSIFSDYVTRELKARVAVTTDGSGNADPGKVCITTGVGTRAATVDAPFIGTWTPKNADFDVVQYRNYLVDTSTGTVTSTLPVAPTDGQTVIYKDAKGKFGTNSLFIVPHAGTTYTIAGQTLGESLELDRNYANVTLVYNLIQNNWSL